MAGIRQVISTLSNDGQEIMGPHILAWRYPDANILNGSLLTVESNHFAVLKSRGAILAVYETGQHVISTPPHRTLNWTCFRTKLLRFLTGVRPVEVGQDST